MAELQYDREQYSPHFFEPGFSSEDGPEPNLLICLRCGCAVQQAQWAVEAHDRVVHPGLTVEPESEPQDGMSALARTIGLPPDPDTVLVSRNDLALLRKAAAEWKHCLRNRAHIDVLDKVLVRTGKV